MPNITEFAIAVDDFNQRAVDLWNAGDLDGFCAGYAEEALYVTDQGLIRGRNEILTTLREFHPEQRDMGKLSLTMEELRVPSGEQKCMGVAILTWEVQKARSHEEGYSMVTYEYRNERLVVTQDMSLTR